VDRTEKPTRYLDNDQRVAVQTLVSGSVETDGRYFVFGNYIDEVLVMHDGAGDLYYAHDHLSSPVALLDDAGAVLERYERACPEHSRGNAYGSVQILTSAFYPLASSQYGNPYTFTGRELDTMDNNTLHLMYCRVRTYDPDTGRFMQRDPLGIDPAESAQNIFNPILQYENKVNLYEYTFSNSIINNDPTGLIPIPMPGVIPVVIDISACGSISINANLKGLSIDSKKSHGLGACFGVNKEKIIEGFEIPAIQKKIECNHGCCSTLLDLDKHLTLVVSYHMFLYGGGIRGDLEYWISFPEIPVIGDMWFPIDL
jgi:RHS repeat-associated protein